MAQKAVLRGEVGCACVAREVIVERGGMGSVSPRHLPTRNVKERQHLLEQVLRRHALRVGLCVFQQIFEVFVVVRFLELLEGSEKTMPQVSKYYNV